MALISSSAKSAVSKFMELESVLAVVVTVGVEQAIGGVFSADSCKLLFISLRRDLLSG